MAGLQLRATMAGRGGYFEAHVTLRGDEVGRVELVLIERKLAVKLDARRTHVRVLSTVEVSAADDVVAVPIPTDVPAAHHGETLAWDHEVRLVVDRLGPDAVVSVPVAVLGEVASADRHPDAHAALDPATSRAVALSSPLTPSAGDYVFLLVPLVAFAAFMVWLGLANGQPVVWGIGLIVGALAAYVVRVMLQQRRLRLPETFLSVPEDSVRRGGPVEVMVSSHAPAGLELGLQQVEVVVSSNGRQNTSVSRVVSERWQRAVPGPNHIGIGADEPSTYEGREVALRWVVALQDPRLPEAKRALSRRRTAVRVMP